MQLQNTILFDDAPFSLGNNFSHRIHSLLYKNRVKIDSISEIERHKRFLEEILAFDSELVLEESMA